MGSGGLILAFGVRLAWVLAVPTVPVSDFAMYRESANYLSEFGHLDPGFIYMPGFVMVLAWVKNAGGGLLAEKMIGVLAGALGAAACSRSRSSSWMTMTRARSHGRRAHRLATCLPLPARGGGGADLRALARRRRDVERRRDGHARGRAAGARARAARDAGPRRPYAAAVAFGLAMGLAAWVRAVALPLSALAFRYWLAARQKLHRAALLTAAGVGATLIVLLPWGIRHVRQSGALYFTDDHGGITALIGANPNSEGTYTRALNRMFKDVTGKSVLDEPHRETDRAAYAIAREWFRFEPGYALGLAALKADRLFDPEHRLLYWSIFRPGVLVGRPAAWFAARRDAIVRFADAFGLAVAGLALAGSPPPSRAGAGDCCCWFRSSSRLSRPTPLLRGTTLPPADRAAGVPVRRAGAGRDRAAGARRWDGRAPASCTRRRRSAGAGAGRRLALAPGRRCSTAERRCARATAGR